MNSARAVVGVRLSGSDFPGHLTIDDACQVAERLERNISYIHVSAGIAESGQWSIGLFRESMRPKGASEGRLYPHCRWVPR